MTPRSPGPTTLAVGCEITTSLDADDALMSPRFLGHDYVLDLVPARPVSIVVLGNAVLNEGYGGTFLPTLEIRQGNQVLHAEFYHSQDSSSREQPPLRRAAPVLLRRRQLQLGRSSLTQQMLQLGYVQRRTGRGGRLACGRAAVGHGQALQRRPAIAGAGMRQQGIDAPSAVAPGVGFDRLQEGPDRVAHPGRHEGGDREGAHDPPAVEHLLVSHGLSTISHATGDLPRSWAWSRTV